MLTPSPVTIWTDLIKASQGEDRLDLIMRRPIVTWFSKEKRMINRLVKVSARLGDDLWIICGFNNEDGIETSSTRGPKSLDYCLRCLTPENGWVLCEFPNESSFYDAALDYLSQ